MSDLQRILGIIYGGSLLDERRENRISEKMHNSLCLVAGNIQTLGILEDSRRRKTGFAALGVTSAASLGEWLSTVEWWDNDDHGSSQDMFNDDAFGRS